MPIPDPGTLASLLRIAPEVQSALDARRPVVALESSIWCQGLPHPQNIEGARRVAAAIRAEGGEPAVLALDDGYVLVGMAEDELERWCVARDALKAGMRDLAWILAMRRRAATTVSACVGICAAAGLPLLATGGVGGVHRGASETFDVSTDLDAMSRFPVLVIASGVKSVLDVGATLERLESLGVPVLGWRTDTFPVFYSPTSHWPMLSRVDTEAEVVRVLRAHRALGLPQGLLLAQAVPIEDGLDVDVVERWVDSAMAKARVLGVRGQAVTPYLLERLHEASHGATLRANLALVENNARLGARVARALLDEPETR